MELFKERDAVVVKYEGGSYEGSVRIKTRSLEGTDPGSETVLVSNQGYAALSFPAGEVRDFYAEAWTVPESEHEDAELLDEGEIIVSRDQE